MSARGFSTFLLACFAIMIVAAGARPLVGQIGTPNTKVAFNRDVRPILTTCFRCHGPDESSRRAGMRLDLRDEALKPRPNGAPIVPGKPDESLVVKRIFETNPARVMPPASIHKDLTDPQKETIRRWVSKAPITKATGLISLLSDPLYHRFPDPRFIRRSMHSFKRGSRRRISNHLSKPIAGR
jgi:hypothetical protein